MKNYKSNNNVVYSCKYHVVWCPKYRRKVLVGSIETRLKELIQETCSTINVEIIEMELMPDHVHLLMEVDPQFGIHKAVKQIKGRTSRILRQEFPELRSKLPTLWTNSYFVSTLAVPRWKSSNNTSKIKRIPGENNMEIIKGYQFRMKPNRKQQNQIEQNNGCGRFVYNHFLNVRSEAWKESKTSISYNKTSEMLTELKKELPWLKDADSMALQESLRDLDKAFQNFFNKTGQIPKVSQQA